MSILFKDINYLDIVNEKIVENVDIYVEEKKIVEIGRDLNRNADEIYNGKDKLMTPSFINGHTHLGMTYFRNAYDDMALMDWLHTIWPIEDKLTGEDIYWSSLLSIIENIKSGATVFCDMYYELENIIEATEKTGIRGIIARGLTDTDGLGNKKLKNLKEIYTSYHNSNDGKIKIIPAPHAIYTCSEKFLVEISNLTKEFDGIMHIHLSETLTEVRDSLEKNKLTPIAYVNSLGLLENHVIAAHCVHITDEEIEIVKNKEFYPIYNPSSNLKLASGFTPINKMLKNNIILGIGTDGSSSNNNQNILEDMHIGAIVNKAVDMDESSTPAVEIVKMATINGAKAMGLSEIGSIEIGKDADLTIFDLNSNNFTPRNNLINALVYSANSSDICDVLCAGKFVMKNRELVGIDEEKTRYMVCKIWEDIKKR